MDTDAGLHVFRRLSQRRVLYVPNGRVHGHYQSYKFIPLPSVSSSIVLCRLGHDSTTTRSYRYVLLRLSGFGEGGAGSSVKYRCDRLTGGGDKSLKYRLDLLNDPGGGSDSRM